VARFGSRKQLEKHYSKHRPHFEPLGVGTEADYVARAAALCAEPCPVDALGCDRQCPDDDDEKLVRYRESSGEYAVMVKATRTLVTFHILRPAGSYPDRRFTHRFATNHEFFNADCECRA
jgi:hypothetical protein